MATALLSTGPAAAAVSAPPANTLVSAGDPRAFQQPSLAMSARHPDHLAMAYMEGSQRAACYLATSVDAGRTWSSSVLIGPSGKHPLPDQFTVCRDPVVAYGSDDSLYYAAQVSATFFSQSLLTVSHDAGATFDPPKLVNSKATAYTGQRGGGDWWPQVAVDGRSGRVYVVWNHYGVGGSCPCTVQVASSTDGGRSFSDPVEVASPGPAPPALMGTYAHGPTAAVGIDGTLYLYWQDFGRWLDSCGYPDVPHDCTTPGILYVSSSADAGRTFRPPVSVNDRLNIGCPGPQPGQPSGTSCDALHYDNIIPHAMPVVAGRKSGQVFVAWCDGDPQGPARITLATSSDGGATWARQPGIPVPQGRTGDHQFLPQLSLSTTGRLDLVFYNRAGDGRQDVYWTHSRDDGANFSTPVLLSDQSSRADVGPPGSSGSVNFGNQLGLVSMRDTAVAAWTDTRRGTRDSAKQDVVTASLAVPSTTSGHMSTYLAVGLGALALALVVGALSLRGRRKARASS